MSIVLDVVQKIVLYSAYELTCAAAAQVFLRFRIINARKFAKFKIAKFADNRMMAFEKPEPPDAALERIKVEPRASSQQLLDSPYTDFSYKSSGPICPPQTSMMRIARDSYFS